MRAPNNSNLAFDRLHGLRSTSRSTSDRFLPRKVPMRLEPRSFFANERTFLSWMGMAVTIGCISAMLTVFNTVASEYNRAEQLISTRTIDVVTCVYVPLSIFIMCYAASTFYKRSRFMRRKARVEFFDDKVGPITIAVLVWITLAFITVLAFIDFFEK